MREVVVSPANMPGKASSVIPVKFGGGEVVCSVKCENKDDSEMVTFTHDATGVAAKIESGEIGLGFGLGYIV